MSRVGLRETVGEERQTKDKVRIGLWAMGKGNERKKATVSKSDIVSITELFTYLSLTKTLNIFPGENRGNRNNSL